MRFLAGWLPVLVVEAVVLFLSSRPGSTIHLPLPRLDKVAHFGEYAVLGFLVFRALRLSGGARRESALWCLAWVALMGLGDEALQSRVPGRDADIQDWFADLLGGAVGLWAATRLEERRPRWFRWGARFRAEEQA